MTEDAHDQLAAAYSSAGTAWARGPARIYGRLAELLVQSAPVPLSGRLMCDVGAGTGVASAALAHAGARVVAADVAAGMLLHEREQRPPSVVADARALPFRDDSFDGLVAAYCYNHLVEPVEGLAEARRICAPGSPVLVSSYAADDTHPVKEAVDRALGELGWAQPEFIGRLREEAIPKLATVDRCREAALAAGFRDIDVEALRVPFPELTAEQLVEWRTGMAQTAWFVDALTPEQRVGLEARAVELLGPNSAPLARSVIHLVAVC